MREGSGRGGRIQTPFGAALKRRRLDLGLSQEELANRAGLHRTYITDVERGSRNPSLDTIQKLTRALGVPLSELFYQIEPAAPGADPLKDGRAVEILIVEDDPRDAEITLLGLKSNNISNSVQIVRDGAEALDFIFCTGAYRNRSMLSAPGVILLDLGLPRVSGVEVLKRIRADRRTQAIPVAVITASRSDEDLKACAELGVDVYVTKPVDFSQLSTAMPKLGLRWLLLGHNGNGEKSAAGNPVTAPQGR